MRTYVAVLFIALVFNIVRADNDNEVPNELFECPKQLQSDCSNVYEPTCAWLDPRINCIAKKYPCAKNVDNSCLACNVRDAVRYSKGKCPESHVMYQSREDKFRDLKINTKICSPSQKIQEFCTMEYNPSCGWLYEKVNCGTAKTPCGIELSNPCVACLHPDVERISIGPCPVNHTYSEEKKDTLRFETCSLDKSQYEICPANFSPKCAWLDEKVNCDSISKPCAIDAGNECEACRIAGSVKFSHGSCPKENTFTKIIK